MAGFSKSGQMPELPELGPKSATSIIVIVVTINRGVVLEKELGGHLKLSGIRKNPA